MVTRRRARSSANLRPTATVIVPMAAAVTDAKRTAPTAQFGWSITHSMPIN